MIHKRKLFINLRNLPGWRTKSKIVIFESDDWGSVRMPSNKAYMRLEKAGLNLKGNSSQLYNLYDSLATAEDLGNLFELLGSFRDKNRSHPVFTAMSVVANPDFEKIRKADYNQYFYEPFTETLKKYRGCYHSFELWKDGINNGVFIPQMHGREHLNVSSWMGALKSGDKHTLLAFNEGMWGFTPHSGTLPRTYYQRAFQLDDLSEIESHREILKTGLDLFERIFGYRAEYFVTPNGQISNLLNKTLFENGIRLRSTTRIQNEPLGNGKFKKRFHYLGQKESNGLHYIIRNCSFEPSHAGIDWIDLCLYEINSAFRWHKPAIIGSHRVNYIGAINKGNRDRSLKQLRILLQSIFKNWPDVEFMTTVQLGKMIKF